MIREKMLIIVVLVLVILAGVLIYRAKVRRQSSQTEAHKSVETLDQEAIAARKALQKSDATESEVYISLVRLAIRNDPLARSEAIKRASNESNLVREGAAEALGYYEDNEAVRALGNLLKDEVSSVRVKALQSAGYRQGDNREAALKEFLSDTEVAEAEKLVAFSSMIRVTKRPEIRDASLDQIIKVAKGGTKNHRSLALKVATQVAPDNREVIKLLRKNITKGGNDEDVALGVRHLSALHDEWLKKEASELAKRKSLVVRIALVESLHLLCPKERWVVLEDLARVTTNKDLLRSVVQAIARLSEKEGRPILERLGKSSRLDQDILQAVREVLAAPASQERPCSP